MPPSTPNRLSTLEERDRKTEALLDRLDERLRFVESQVQRQDREQSHQSQQLLRMAETSERVVRLQEQFAAQSAANKDSVDRITKDIEQVQSTTSSDHAQRLTRLETIAEEQISNARRAGAEVGGVTAFLVVAATQAAELLKGWAH